MTPQLAHEYIQGRMKQMGYEGSYYVRFRHFVLAPLQTVTVEQPSQMLVLAEPKECIRVESATGIFDLSENNVNELQYEHQGTVTLTSYSAITQQVPMIQVVFKKK